TLLLMTIQNGFAQSEPLPTGADAPLFTAKASMDGSEFDFSLEEALADGPVVLYFFPAAYTGGCDLEARTFAEYKDKFESEGVTIVGMSADNIQRLNSFSADPDYCAGEFPVASDPEGKIAATYGLEIKPAQSGAKNLQGDDITHGYIPRTTFVIANGKIKAVFSSKTDDLSPDEHVTESLAIVQEL
ncbi:MAG TPA: peroxiredoxin, partial [Fodinibius sp.]|nr:peroxiredoxin [Fodinibius sp.]